MKNSEQIKEETEKMRLDIEKRNLELRGLLKKGLTSYIVQELILGTGKIINDKDINITKLVEETSGNIESLVKECVSEAVSIAQKITNKVVEKNAKRNG